VPRGASREYEKVYPFGWLGLLADVAARCSTKLIYANTDRGFALCSMRSPTRSRYYLQVPLDRQGGAVAGRRRSGRKLRLRLDPEARERLVTGSLAGEEHRPAAQLRRRADALRPPAARRRRRPHRAADGRKGLNLAASDVKYLASGLIEHYQGAQQRRPGPLLRPRPCAACGRRALLLVVHLADAQVPQ
jgi:p-hydroxybenzoate 3-monooxygenase